MKVLLNSFDLSYIAMYAERIYVVKSLYKVPSTKYDVTRSEWEVIYTGMMGEYAVKKATGCQLSMDISIGGKPEADVIVGGKTAQIKTNNYAGKNLEFYMNDMDSFNADILIGVQVLSPVLCDIAGYIDKEKFRSTANIKNYGYGERLSIPSTSLESITKIIIKSDWQSLNSTTYY
jgi:hypothetical protein